MTTDEMIEVMARAIKAQWDAAMMKQADASSGTFDYEPGEPGDWQEFVPEAHAALSAILPVLREDIAGETTTKEDVRISVSCPDGLQGCLVAHYRTEKRHRNCFEIDQAIRARFDEITKEIDNAKLP